MTFEEARRRYLHRFTMEHIPEWAKKPAPNGKFYAPHYRSDQEWYENSLFPPNNPYGIGSECHSANQSWSLGQWLDNPYRRN